MIHEVLQFNSVNNPTKLNLVILQNEIQLSDSIRQWTTRKMTDKRRYLNEMAGFRQPDKRDYNHNVKPKDVTMSQPDSNIWFFIYYSMIYCIYSMICIKLGYEGGKIFVLHFTEFAKLF